MIQLLDSGLLSRASSNSLLGVSNIRRPLSSPRVRCSCHGQKKRPYRSTKNLIDVTKKRWPGRALSSILSDSVFPPTVARNGERIEMTWTTPVFEEVPLCCEINSYASATL